MGHKVFKGKVPATARDRIYYVKGMKYQLVSTFITRTGIKPPRNIHCDTIHLYKNGLLIIEIWNACDGPSGPTKDSRKNMLPAWIHDALTKLVRRKLLARKRLKTINRRFKRDLKKCGMGKKKAHLYYLGGSLGAHFASKPKARRKVYTSP